MGVPREEEASACPRDYHEAEPGNWKGEERDTKEICSDWGGNKGEQYVVLVDLRC
jgi:hypothetical protein